MLRVKNATYLKDEAGKAVCEVFNNNGEKLVPFGQAIPTTLLGRAVYVQKESASLIRIGSSNHIRQVNSESHPSMNTHDIRFVNESDEEMLKKYYSERMVRLYSQISSRVKEIITSRDFTFQTLKQAEEIVEECYSADLHQLLGILYAVRNKDNYTSDHSFSVFLLFLQSVEDFKECIAEDGFYDSFKQRTQKVNFNRDSVKKYALGALLHDYGKVFVPDEIIQKPGPLSDSEFTAITKHTAYGVKALLNVGVDDPEILRVVGDHHGAYRVFKNEDQNPLAQICNIVDIYDATQTDRIYKPAMTHDETMAVLYLEKNRRQWSSYIFSNLMNRTIPDFRRKKFVRAS